MGADSNLLGEVPLLGNQVDRFVWNGSTLAFDRNIISLRARQTDSGQAERGNQNGGVLRFGSDGKLYVLIGDVGRRGQLQNLVDGPVGPGTPDDAFGGPAPDNAHLTGVILRLNDDGRLRATTRSTRWARRSVVSPAPTPRGSLRTGSATASGWPSTRAQAACGRRRTATTASTSSTGLSPDSTRGGFRSWVRPSASPSTRRSRPTPRRRSRSPPAATSASSRSAGRPPTSPTPSPGPFRTCSRCRARTTAHQSSRGSSASPRAASGSSTGTPLAGATPTTSSSVAPGTRSRAASSSVSISAAGDRPRARVRRPAGCGPGRRQPAQVRNHRKREPALRSRLRHHDRYPDGTEREPVLGLPVAGRRLRDLRLRAGGAAIGRLHGWRAGASDPRADGAEAEAEEEAQVLRHRDRHLDPGRDGEEAEDDHEELVANQKTKIKAKLKRKAKTGLARKLEKNGKAKVKVTGTATVQSGATATDTVKVKLKD